MHGCACGARVKSVATRDSVNRVRTEQTGTRADHSALDYQPFTKAVSTLIVAEEPRRVAVAGAQTRAPAAPGHPTALICKHVRTPLVLPRETSSELVARCSQQIVM